MMRTVLLGDIVRIRRGASPRPIQDYIQSTPGVPWVKIADATSANSRFISSTKEYIKEDGRRKSVEVSPGTLILSNSATPGLPMIMKIEACVHDGWLVLDELKGVDRDWLYYFLLNRREISAKAASGSVFSNLKTDIVRRFEVLLPPIGQQKKIANILGSLDEKIDLNRRMNETLEQLGQALFRHYFVDNPEAKNWDEGTLGDIMNITMGQSPPGKSYNNNGDGVVFYQGRADFGLRYPNMRLFTTDPKRFAKVGDVLLTVRAPVGDVNQASERCCIGRGLAAISSRTGAVSFCYYYCHQLKADFLEYNSEGTVFGSINSKQLKALKLKIPPIGLVEKFENEVAVIDKTIMLNSYQVKMLITLRDSLLPKLISGGIEV